MKKYFKLFANCILVKGAKRCVIVDLQRNSYHIVPSDLYEIIYKSKANSIESIFSEYGEYNKNIILEYFSKLEKLELGFFCEESELNYFVDLNLNYDIPRKISSCIVENQDDICFFKKIITELESFGCEYVEIIFYKKKENKLLENILSLFAKSLIKHIGLIVKYDSTKNESYIMNLTSTQLRLSSLIIHSSNKDVVLDVEKFNFANVVYTSKGFNSYKFCGNFDTDYFTPNLFHFSESQNHNTCLNSKISIDKDGDIKNCPSMQESFGNIKDTSLEESFKHPNFKKYWNINKDQIDVCRDCEFRHICTDCRAYTENPEDQYSKPLKCGYDPYTSVWEEWSTNPLKQKAIEFYGMQELVKKENV